MTSLENFIDFCDEMQIAEEGFFDRFKKTKIQSTKPNQSQNKNFRNLTKQELNNLIPVIKNIEKSLLTSQYKAKIQKEIEEGFRDGRLDEKLDSEYRKFKFTPGEGLSVEDTWINILDLEQGMKSCLSFIIEDIAKKLREMAEYKNYKFETGDGDEGCIYPSICDDIEN